MSSTVYDLTLDVFLLFGDSITQRSHNPEIHGWGAMLTEAYVRKLDVVNRGYGGYNTEWCRILLPSILSSVLPRSPEASPVRPPRITMMTIFLGANDAALPEANPHAHVALPRYKENLHAMLEIVRSMSPSTRVILIAPGPVDSSSWVEHCKVKGRDLDRTPEHTLKYNKACLEVASEASAVWGKNLICVDATDAFAKYGRPVEELLLDGLHFSVDGNKALGDAILKSVKEAWPDLDPEVLKMRVPTHEDVDKSDLSMLFKDFR